MSSPEHRIDPTTLRHLLVERARARVAEQARRGAGSDAGPAAAEAMKPTDLIVLDAAIEKLQLSHPRHARLVDLRFFGGLNVAETAAALGISEETVRADWRFARGWLNCEMAPDTR